MTKITKLDKKSLTDLRPEIDAALKELGERLGLKLRAGNGSYSPDGAEAHFKLEIKVDDPAVQEAAERAEFDRYCGMFDLIPEDFGLEFRAGSKRYKLLGLELKRRKWPLKVRDLDADKVVLLTDAAVLHIKMARPAKAAA